MWVGLIHGVALNQNGCIMNDNISKTLRKMNKATTLKNKCGGCKWLFAYSYANGDKCQCEALATLHDTKLTAPRCGHYKPLGTEPESGMCYADFVYRCKSFFNNRLAPKGYTMCVCHDLTGPAPTAHPDYHVEFSRHNPRTDQNEWFLMIDFDAKMSEAILYENFDSVEQIPSEYGDVRNKNLLGQPPQFVYGYFSRLGDALNSTLKGCSIDLRKPIELYY